MKAQALIRLKLPSKKQTAIIAKSLEPETSKPLTTRSKASIRHEKDVLTLKFEANDSAALRAVVNSYLHWISLSIDTLAKLEQLNKT
ncbi:MAG: KEOPS complex subunit Pcc1 [Candidatus Bathyarchaeales archaeon]